MAELFLQLRPFLHLYRQQWRRMALGLGLAILTLLASIGLLSVSGWFISATAAAALWITRSADFNYLLPAGAVRGLSVARTAFRWCERVVSHDATFRLLANLRGWFFRKLAPQRSQQLGQLRQGDLLNRMVADIDALDHIYLRLVTPMIAAAVTIVFVSALVGYFAATAGLVLFIVLSLLLLTVPVVFYRLGQAPSRAVANEQQQLRQHLLDYLQGHNELRVFAGIDKQLARISSSETQLISQQRRMASLTGLSQGLMILCNSYLVLALLVLGYQAFAADNAVGPLLALVVFATMASLEAIAPAAGAFQHLGHTATAASRLNQVLQQPDQLQFGTLAACNQFELQIQQLQFSYQHNPEPVLVEVNLTIKPGEKVALVGQTGCGKSTLLQLLTRELDASAGTINLAGEAIAAYSQTALRQMITVVSQRVHVFNDSLANNLRIANPAASDQQLTAVLEQVQLHGLLKGDGLNQWLGDGGRQLSGGEQRRLGLARALLHPAPLLLLDEPTEGLDDSTEAAIIAELIDNQPQRSILYVTHKPAALAKMDSVYQMENGTLQPL
ncbi:heme ABC transporter ATP-binding protein/permease CydC [Ferrimonas senticii]|uniref:heme ABC transporter ATP-binding protein/permease CydC n=1 Tax=Ferrimonas senticii TaxID=394566 RepID=UPI00041E7300|nr:cysteine/glutathione ABC transporter ATP-binding protein/permease CydC [Ferrimonas senticii]